MCMKKNKKVYWPSEPKPTDNPNLASTNNVFVALVNPLAFLEADDRFDFGQKNRELTPESVLKYLANETFIPEMDNIHKSMIE